MSNTGNQIVKSKCRLLTTVFYSSDRVANYALEGAIFIAGAGI